jgi:TonB family protein
MDSTSQKWLIGCGSGCAVVVILAVGLVIGTIVFVREKFRPLQEASSSHTELAAAYGTADSFAPSPSGEIRPERMETFLLIRDSLKEPRERLDKELANFDFGRLTQPRHSFGDVLRTLSQLSDLIAPIGDYIGRRNRALLDRHMGLGEYAYIYSLSYHSWLAHLPEEGPPVLARLRFRSDGRHAGGNDGFSPEAIRWRYRRLMTRLLQNQLNGMGANDPKEWRDTLREEIARLDAGLERIAWQDNLPPRIAESLKPYRGRLEASYSPSTNCFELLTLEESRQIEWNRPEKEPEAESGSVPAPAEAPPVLRSRASPGVSGTSGASGRSSISFTVQSGVTAPIAIAQRMPAYTEEARRARVEGVVTIQAIVRRDGSVGSARVIHRLGSGLDEAALNTVVNDWRFKPGNLNGRPVEVRTTIDIIFRLN